MYLIKTIITIRYVWIKTDATGLLKSLIFFAGNTKQKLSLSLSTFTINMY